MHSMPILVVGRSCSCILTKSLVLFFFKQKTAYELRSSDWSSDVSSSDLPRPGRSSLDVPFSLPVRVYFQPDEIGRASCRERVCEYVYISVVAVAFNKHDPARLIRVNTSINPRQSPHSSSSLSNITTDSYHPVTHQPLTWQRTHL